MAIAEDPTIYLSDHGDSVTAGAVSGLGILDQAGELVMDGNVMLVDYLLTAEQSKFGGLRYNDAIIVNGVSYKVENHPLPVADGVFVVIPLSKV